MREDFDARFQDAGGAQEEIAANLNDLV